MKITPKILRENWTDENGNRAEDNRTYELRDENHTQGISWNTRRDCCIAEFARVGRNEAIGELMLWRIANSFNSTTTRRNKDAHRMFLTVSKFQNTIHFPIKTTRDRRQIYTSMSPSSDTVSSRSDSPSDLSQAIALLCAAWAKVVSRLVICLIFFRPYFLLGRIKGLQIRHQLGKNILKARQSLAIPWKNFGPIIPGLIPVKFMGAFSLSNVQLTL